MKMYRLVFSCKNETTYISRFGANGFRVEVYGRYLYLFVLHATLENIIKYKKTIIRTGSDF